MPTRPPRAQIHRVPGQPARPSARRRPSPHTSLYDSPEWKQASREYRAQHPYCECPEHNGTPHAPRSACVDHTVAHHGDRALFWDRANWCAMAWRCHSRKTSSEDGGFGNKRRATGEPGAIPGGVPDKARSSRVEDTSSHTVGFV